MEKDDKKEIRTISVKIPIKILKRADRLVDSGFFGSRNDLILDYCRQFYLKVRDLIDENDGLVGPTKYKRLSEISIEIKRAQKFYQTDDDEEIKQIIFRISQPFASKFESLLKLMDLNWSEVIRYSLLSQRFIIEINLDSVDKQIIHNKIKEEMMKGHIPVMDDSDYTDD